MVEHLTFNQVVAGSSPARLTNKSLKTKQVQFHIEIVEITRYSLSTAYPVKKSVGRLFDQEPALRRIQSISEFLHDGITRAGNNVAVQVRS